MNSAQDHHSKSGMIIFILSMALSLGFFIYIAYIHPGVQGIDKLQDPKKLEEATGGQAAAKVESVDPDSVDNPWISSAGLIAAGNEVYQVNCATCHGKTGLADGLASTPDTRNLVEGEWKAGGTSIALYQTLQNGLEGTGMVSFKASLSPAKRWALVHWIRSITDNKVDDPEDEKIQAFAKTAD